MSGWIQRTVIALRVSHGAIPVRPSEPLVLGDTAAETDFAESHRPHGGRREYAPSAAVLYWRASVMPSPVKPEPVIDPVIDSPATVA